jgi:hypothetical protein
VHRVPDIDAINEGDVEERDRVLRETEQRASRAEARAEARSFPRLRVNVTDVSPGYVTASFFQSDNGGTNWGCVGSGVTFPDGWFKETFGKAERGRRIEFEITGVHEVTG